MYHLLHPNVQNSDVILLRTLVFVNLSPLLHLYLNTFLPLPLFEYMIPFFPLLECTRCWRVIAVLVCDCNVQGEWRSIKMLVSFFAIFFASFHVGVFVLESLHFTPSREMVSFYSLKHSTISIVATLAIVFFTHEVRVSNLSSFNFFFCLMWIMSCMHV